jgi:hypothetical protein
MPPCAPLADPSFSLPAGGIPGFAIPLPNLSLPNIPLPLNDLIALFNELDFILPVGNLKPNFEPDFFKDLLAGIFSILEKFQPFLMIYSMFLPLLNLLLCIIEILCALNDPFKIIRALIRLFRVCIPEFLALFPFFALILMIISLILLLLALIEYLINRILAMILLIIRNIEILISATSRLDNDSVVAIVKKIGDLLCLLQNLFVIFGVIALIIEIIKTLLSLVFRIPPCDSTDGSNDGCCTTDVCPAFIKDNAQNGITSSTGNFLYFNEVGTDSGLTLPFGFPPIIDQIRAESWQFYDADLPQNQQFINITNAFDLPSGTTKIFFPAGTNYNDSTDPLSVPYTVNFRLFYNPFVYDQLGLPRFIRINNAIVKAPPTNGVENYDNVLIAPFTGTLNLVGGTITEDDGVTVIKNTNGSPMTIDEVFHAPINQNGPIPLPTDGVLYSNLTYTFTINTEILFASSLITAGCLPDVAAARDAINTTIGAQFNLNGINLSAVTLPDVTAAQNCVLDSVATLKQSISLETMGVFQTNVIACLTNLQTSASSSLAQVISAGFDQYHSTFSLDPSIQFTTLPIVVTVSLEESSDNLMTNNLPASTAATLASQLSANATLGSVSPFTYDGYQFFTADLTSSVPGNGTIKVAFNNNYISVLNNPSDIDQPVTVTVTQAPYTFVQSVAPSGQPRRDEGDVARDDVSPGG